MSVMLLLLGISATATAHAATVNSCAHTTDQLNSFLADQHHAGTSQSQLDAKLRNQFCVTKISTTLPHPAGTHNDDVNVGTPDIYYDAQARDYVAVSSWNWTANSLKKQGDLYTEASGDCWWPAQNCSLGGRDGVALGISGPIQVTGGALQWWGNSKFGYSVTYSPTDTTNGAGFTAQDVYNWDAADMSMANGEIVIYFHNAGACQTIIGEAKYQHTWDSTAVTGFSIGYAPGSPPSIGVSLNSQSNTWPKASWNSRADIC